MESNKKKPAMASRDPAQLAGSLLGFFDRVARDLPWRRRRDVYGIWISEVMLQQTQVVTVLPRYVRFIARFPDVEALAAANLDEVLAEWAGLGYYRRARQLHQAAQEIVRRGFFPTSSAELATLPGIGPYTAAAIASIALNERIPVLDGNVERVLCRFLALEEDPKTRATRQQLFQTAFSLLTEDRPGDGNQALMELGATVCTPTRADCPSCPLRSGCAGQTQWQLYPRPRNRRATERQAWVMAWVEADGAWLLFRRNEEQAVLAGLWEFPTVPAGPLDRVEKALGETYGGVWSLGSAVLKVRHAITYRDLHVTVHRATQQGDFLGERRWYVPSAIRELPTSSLVAKVVEGLVARLLAEHPG